MGVANGDGAWRGLVTIVELIDPRSYIFQSAMYGRLIYTVIYMSDRLLTQANPDPRLPPPPELRRCQYVIGCQSTQETMAQSALDDVANNLRQAPPGEELEDAVVN